MLTAAILQIDHAFGRARSSAGDLVEIRQEVRSALGQVRTIARRLRPEALAATDEDLVEACRAAMRGEPFLYPAAVTALIRDRLQRARSGEDPPEDPLTPRELEVLKLIAETHTSDQNALELGIARRTSTAIARTCLASSVCAIESSSRATRCAVDSCSRSPYRPAMSMGRAPMHRAVGAESLCGVTRVMVLVGAPPHLKLEEAEAWLHGEAAPLACLAQVKRAALSRLGSASERWGDEWGWLIELDFPDAQSARQAVRDDACAILLGDLRLLGMRPTVALIEGARELGP